MSTPCLLSALHQGTRVGVMSLKKPATQIFGEGARADSITIDQRTYGVPSCTCPPGNDTLLFDFDAAKSKILGPEVDRCVGCAT
jgi:hypothetical protein